MKTLAAIIVLHLLAIYAGRNYRKIDYMGIAVLVILTLLMATAVLYGLYTIENPKVDHY